MLKKVARLFQAPQFEDEEKSRKAMLLNVVILACLTTLPIAFLGIILDEKTPRFEVALFLIGSCWVILFGMRFVMLAGHIKTAGITIIVTFFIAITLNIYNVGTPRAPATFAYLTVIIIAGLVVGRRAMAWVTLLTSTVISLLWIGEQNGLLPEPTNGVNIAQVIVIILIVVVTAVLFSLALKSMESALAQARQELAERTLAKEREARRQEMMEKVIRIGKSVTEKTSDLHAALHRIWDGVRNGLGFDRAAIFLYDPNTEMMQGSYGTDRFGHLAEEWNMKFSIAEQDSGSFFRIVLSQPDGFYFTKDYETERGLLTRPGHIMRGVKYYAAVGVWAGNKPLAMICVDQLLSGRIITEEQVEALRFFAGYAGLAIENARLSERELNHRQMMERVIQIGKAVTAQATDLQETLLRIHKSVRNDLDFDRAALFLYDPEKKTIHGTYGTDRSGNQTEEWGLKFETDSIQFLQRIIRQPDGFYHTQDYERDIQPWTPPDAIMKGVKHFVAVACWSGDKPIAAICADQLLSGRSITAEQQEALRLFAGYAGLAIDNARLNTELKSHVQEREQFIQELGKRNAELERFTYTVSHDLRSPIITIKGFIGMLEKDIREGQMEKADKDMLRIANATDKMASLLADLLELSRIGRLVNPPEEIDLVKLAYDTLETVDGRLRKKSITVHVSPDIPTIYADRIRMGEVLENLIDNAAKYMGNQPNPHIEIGVRVKNQEQIIYVKDNGIGMESQYFQRVFGLFEKLDVTSEGTGIGLALIKRIIEVHGGQIWIESDGLGHGSTFCFTIPDSRKSGS